MLHYETSCLQSGISNSNPIHCSRKMHFFLFLERNKTREAFQAKLCQHQLEMFDNKTRSTRGRFMRAHVQLLTAGSPFPRWKIDFSVTKSTKIFLSHRALFLLQSGYGRRVEEIFRRIFFVDKSLSIVAKSSRTSFVTSAITEFIVEVRLPTSMSSVSSSDWVWKNSFSRFFSPPSSEKWNSESCRHLFACEKCSQTAAIILDRLKMLGQSSKSRMRKLSSRQIHMLIHGQEFRQWVEKSFHTSFHFPSGSDFYELRSMSFA